MTGLLYKWTFVFHSRYGRKCRVASKVTLRIHILRKTTPESLEMLKIWGSCFVRNPICTNLSRKEGKSLRMIRIQGDLQCQGYCTGHKPLKEGRGALENKQNTGRSSISGTLYGAQAFKGEKRRQWEWAEFRQILEYLLKKTRRRVREIYKWYTEDVEGTVRGSNR